MHTRIKIPKEGFETGIPVLRLYASHTARIPVPPIGLYEKSFGNR